MTTDNWLQKEASWSASRSWPAIFFFIREVRHRFREGADDVTTYWIRVGATTGLVVIAFQEFVEFSLQMPGNAVLLTVLAAIAIHRPPPRRPEMGPPPVLPSSPTPTLPLSAPAFVR